MTTEEIMDFRRAVPFRPFELRLRDGRRFVVPDAVHIGRDESGEKIIVAAQDDTFETFPPSDISEVKLTSTGQARRAK